MRLAESHGNMSFAAASADMGIRRPQYLKSTAVFVCVCACGGGGLAPTQQMQRLSLARPGPPRAHRTATTQHWQHLREPCNPGQYMGTKRILSRSRAGGAATQVEAAFGLQDTW